MANREDTMTDGYGERCEHGALARVCPICELQEENAELREAWHALRDELGKHQYCLNKGFVLDDWHCEACDSPEPLPHVGGCAWFAAMTLPKGTAAGDPSAYDSTYRQGGMAR
jgi:hypothetical protein